MKKNYFILSVLFLSVVFMSISQTVSAQSSEDEQAIKKTVLNYIEGWYSADTSRMGLALSTDLKKRGFLINPETSKVMISDASYSQMIEWTGHQTKKLGEDSNNDINIKIIEIGKNIANVKTMTIDFVDYIKLGKINGEWKIYNVVWEPNNNQKR